MQHSEEPLSKKAARGSIWVFASRIINRSFGFIRTIIIARLLAPEDFGLFGIAILAMATLETFSQTGFHTTLIQKKENVDPYLDTTWTISVIRGILLFLILFFSAPSVALFFNSPQAELVIKIIAVSTIFSGFTNVGILFFQKELEFNKQFIYEFSATIVDLTVAVTLAFILHNVWALVWGGLAANFVRLLMSYILNPYRPHFRFERSEFKELIGFGKWVFGSSILIFLITQGDDIFVGKILGVTALGLYQMAYLISNLPATEITHVISQVTFPVYSKLQEHSQRLRAVYLDVLRVTVFLSMPLAGGMFILASEFTQIFLGEKWTDMVAAMQILCIFGMTRSFGATMGPVFYGVGKPDILTKLAALQLFLFILIVYPLTTQWGLIGVSVAVVIPNIFVQSFAAFKIRGILQVNVSSIFSELFFPFIGTSALVISIEYTKKYFVMGLWSLIIYIFVGIIVYLFTVFILDFACSSKYRQSIFRLIKSIY